MNSETKSIQIGYFPECKRRITKLHHDYYKRKYDFGEYFKSKVSRKLDLFFDDFTINRDCIWTLHANSKIEGSVLIDGSDNDMISAHLLLFFVSAHLRCNGFGSQLLSNAISFCQKHDYQKIDLITFKGLDDARHLYEKNGFQIIRETQGKRWGPKMIEQEFELILNR